MFTTLVSVDEIDALPDNHCIVDCRFSLLEPQLGFEQYSQTHIPGAVYAHLDDDLSGEIRFRRSGRHPLPQRDAFVQTLRRWGVDNETQLITYDDAGGAFAARLWWLLRWVGHSSVAVLDGGWSAWQAAGKPSTAATTARSASRFSANRALNDSVVADDLIAQTTYTLIDAREGARFRGEAEPIDPVAGHIPGALNIPCQRNLTASKHFKSVDELRALYRDALGDSTIDSVVCYCGSGVTAAHNALAMTHAGLGTPKLYAGSWSEWITDPDRPIARLAASVE